ncbi:tetratricopeptide repeat protein [Desulfovibrio mangrovi]|uniref:tetratricopeptide repeat protein n=1 Tax=Desulfovibrio mangrovi TaxID=2976983 RepID=UPI00224567D9|nr:tetratricopeptide repeat protein [Desulfovibrio mangrovi]UZP68297.1 tetratricopeptide repeat protein [Desulfovibrio mangrovi]
MSILRRFWPGVSGKRSGNTILSPVRGTPPGERDTRAAIHELSQAVRNDPDAVEIYLALGNLFRSQGEIERAVQIRSNLIVRPGLDDKFKARAYFELGHDYKRGGFMDRAMQAFEQARKLGGETEDLLRSMARLSAETGNFQNASSLYGKLNHRIAQAHYMVRHAEELYDSGAVSDSKRLLSKALKVYSGSVEAWLALISLATTDREWKKTGSLLTEALRAVAPSMRFLLLEGMIGFAPSKADIGTEDDAQFTANLCKVIMPAIEAQEPDLILQYYGALFLLRCGNPEEANAWLAKTMVLCPDFWAARLELLGLSMDDQPLSPVFRNHLAFFVDQAKKVKRFVCSSCGMRRSNTFYVCPRCRSWHSAAFRVSLQD